MKALIKQIVYYLEEKFKTNPKRLSHIYSVRDKAIHLGKIYHGDLNKLTVASLLHDATKNDTMEDILLQLKDLNQTDDIKEVPRGCLHAYSAMLLAKNKFKIDDQDILNAITYHCSGRKAMSLLEQIIYVSDFIEESRTFVDDDLRRLAEEDIDLTTYRIMDRTIKYIEKNNQKVSRMTYEALDYYQNKIGGNK